MRLPFCVIDKKLTFATPPRVLIVFLSEGLMTVDVDESYVTILSHLKTLSPSTMAALRDATNASARGKRQANKLGAGPPAPPANVLRLKPMSTIPPVPDTGLIAATVQLEHSYVSEEGELSINDDVVTDTTTLISFYLDQDNWVDGENATAAAALFLHRDHGGFVADNAFALEVDQRIRRSEIDREVDREPSQQRIEDHLRPFPLIPHAREVGLF